PRYVEARLALHLLYPGFHPAIWFLHTSATWILKTFFRMDPVADPELAHSEEELRVILTEAEPSESGTESSNELLINALDFRQRVDRDIMTPRGDVLYRDIQDSCDRNAH